MNRFSALMMGLALSGCGDPLVRAELTDLRKQLDETRGRAVRAEQKAESLEDRVFLLTDRMESAQVASRARPASPPRLPVITLKPREDQPVDGEGDITYEGDARSPAPERARPLLLTGTPSPKHTPPHKTPDPVVPVSTSDNLGVAPAPHLRGSKLDPKIDTGESDPARAYKAAYDLLRAGQHDAAADKLRAFVRRFPKHEYADNAQYWLGEAFYDRHRYGEAAAEFRTAVEKFPLGNKAPDALVKLGYCLLALGDAQKGRDVLKQVPESYPNTDAARLAGEKLAELH